MATRLPIWSLCILVACAQQERTAETAQIGEWSESASNGRVVAAMHRGDLVISRNGREAGRLASATSSKAPHFLFFTPDGMLRVYPQQRFEPATKARPQIAEMLTIDPEHLRIVQRCRVSSTFPGLYLRPSADGSRLIALEKQRTHISLYSGDGCRKIGDLATTGKLRAAAFSPDGGVAAVFAAAGGGALFARYDRVGHLQWSTPLQGSTGDAVVFVSYDGARSLVGLNPFARVDGRWSGGWKLFRVDENSITPISPSGCAPERALDFWGSPALSAGIDHIVLQCAEGRYDLKL